MFKPLNKENVLKNMNVFWAYFLFLLKTITRNFTNWMLFIAYALILSLILLIIPAILDSSPADYWNNPLVQVASFVMPIVAVFASCIALDLFRDGVDTGVELIIISKPISRINYVLVKFSLLLITLLIYSLVTCFLGVLTYAIPKMNPALVGDLVAGLFTGSFVIGLFFGSLSILISLKFGKNATNMIIILIAIIFNFLTPLSQLFFDPPAKVLRNSGINLLQQNIKTTNGIDGNNIVYQLPNSFGTVKYVDVKNEYQKAEAKTFYNNSFYFNIGNMISSLYNLGGLAPYTNGNISILPINTTWEFISPINKDNFTHIFLGLPSGNASNSLVGNTLNPQYIFLPLPSSDNAVLNSFFSSSLGYTFLSDETNNQSTKVSATIDLYDKNDLKIDSSLTNANDSMSLLLDNNITNQIINDVNGINNLQTAQENINKIISIYASLLNQQDMLIYQTNFEENYLDQSYEKYAKNVFQGKVSLFYGLDALNRDNGLKNYQNFVQSIKLCTLTNGINNSWLVQDQQWNGLDAELLKIPLYNALKTQIIINDTPEERNQLIGATLQTFFINQYSAIYLLNALEDSNVNRIYSTNLGLNVLQEEQLLLSYTVKTLPIIDPTIIVAIMIIISFSLFVGIGFIYYYQDIK